MRAQERALARRQLDKRLKSMPHRDIFARPPRGWIKAIREALGMTAGQLGTRLGVSQPRVLKIEEAEVSGSVTMETLERTARALDCQLVYVLVPRKPLEEMTRERAERLARKQLRITGHSMALEDQSVDASEEHAQLEELTRGLLARSPSKLWDGP
jgi:predicted DNA-binding mobile mystery protein A